MDMEERLYRIDRLADNLSVLSKGLADISSEAEGAVAAISESLKREVEEAMDLLFPEGEETKKHSI